jgi:hypothetical protein
MGMFDDGQQFAVVSVPGTYLWLSTGRQRKLYPRHQRRSCRSHIRQYELPETRDRCARHKLPLSHLATHPSGPPLTSVARLMCAHADEINGPPLEPAPQKQLKSQKTKLKTPLEPAKKRWSRTPHLCSPNWSGGTVTHPASVLHLCTKHTTPGWRSIQAGCATNN